PGEEGHDGAAHMLREGLLDVTGRRPVAAYALHAAATTPAGALGNRPGPALAASATVTITLHGRGGHGAWPHRSRDPIPAAAAIVTALQTLVTRRFDVLDPVVVSVGSVHAGTGPTIVPETATLGATLRAFRGDTLTRLAASIREVADGVAAAHGVTAEVSVVDGYPVTENDTAETAFVRDVVADLLGDDRVTPVEAAALVSDDIGRVLAEVPGVMTSLGACPPGLDPTRVSGNHAPDALFDDSVLAEGAALLAELALRRTSTP
ncbi:MAG: amidohydrolase, partial [Actinobacteria bacterium]|nr:amidohydrolase [Actinomycetota bacterium]